MEKSRNKWWGRAGRDVAIVTTHNYNWKIQLENAQWRKVETNGGDILETLQCHNTQL